MSTELTTRNEILALTSISEAMQLADVMAGSVVTVPKHLQGKPSDCLAIILQAAQFGMNPFAVAQKTHLVGGTLGYESQLVNAVICSSTAIEGRFHYEYGGEWKSDKDPTAWVRAGAILRGETEITWGENLFPAVVTTKNSPLWKTAPKQQAAYLAVKYWARLYCPHVILGVYSPDEVADRPHPEIDITPPAERVSALQRPAETEPVDNEPTMEKEADMQAEAAAILNKMTEAKTMDELDRASMSISTTPFGDHTLSTLRNTYNDRRNKIAPKKSGE